MEWWKVEPPLHTISVSVGTISLLRFILVALALRACDLLWDEHCDSNRIQSQTTICRWGESFGKSFGEPAQLTS